MNENISYYDNPMTTRSSRKITIRALMNGIKSGEWRLLTERVRKMKPGEQRRRLKQTIPAVTISGTFDKGRKDGDLIRHSGYIAIDVDASDNVDVQKRRKQLQNDPFVCGYFTSIGGEGLCIIFKIKGSTHKYAYENISAYILEKYNLTADPSCKNVSRIRFVSWDPSRYWKHGKLRFDMPEPRPKDAPKNSDYDLGDIEELVAVAEQKRKDIMQGYQTWYRIGQALAIFGEQGRELFHRLSKINKKEYDKDTADRQYDNCLEQETRGMRDVRVGPGTIFYIAQQHNVLLKPTPTYVSTRK